MRKAKGGAAGDVPVSLITMEGWKTNMKELRKKKGLTIVLAVLAGMLCASALNATVTEEKVLILGNMGNDIAMLGFMAAGISVLIFILHKSLRMECPPGRLFHVFGIISSLIFGAISFGGKYYQQNLSVPFRTLFVSLEQAFAVAVVLAGWSLLYWEIFLGVYYLIQKAAVLKATECGSWISVLFSPKWIFLTAIVLLLIVWIPQYIIRFPGTSGGDAWDSLYYYLHPEGWSNRHPVTYALLIGRMFDLTKSTSTPYMYIAIITGMQTLLTIFCIAWTMRVLAKIDTPMVVRILSLAFFVFIPIFPSFATTVICDSPFLAGSMLLTTELLYYLLKGEEFRRSPVHLLLSVLGVLLLYMRKNGLYVAAAVAAIVLIREIVLLLRKKVRLVAALLVVLVFVGGAAAGFGCFKYLENKYTVANVSDRTKMAMMIQQVGRTVKEHLKEMTDKEVEELSRYFSLEPEKFRKVYSSRAYDSLRPYFLVKDRPEATSFIRYWLHLVRRFPDSAINAFFHQNHYLFDLQANNRRYYVYLMTSAESGKRDFGWIFDESGEVAERRKNLGLLYKSVDTIPIVGLFTSQAIYTVLLFALCLIWLNSKDKRLFLLLVPMVLTVGICLVAPACYHHARYSYPIVYSMPALIAASIFIARSLKQRIDVLPEEAVS